MRGIDGNYLNTQGDASARLQMVYQTEQNRQQFQAQVQATDALRKLREQVIEAQKKDASQAFNPVTDDEEGSKANGYSEGHLGGERGSSGSHENDEGTEQELQKQHIDIRV